MKPTARLFAFTLLAVLLVAAPSVSSRGREATDAPGRHVDTASLSAADGAQASLADADKGVLALVSAARSAR